MDRNSEKWLLEKPNILKRGVSYGLLIGALCAVWGFVLGGLGSLPFFLLGFLLGGVIAAEITFLKTDVIYGHTIVLDDKGEVINEFQKGGEFWRKRWEKYCQGREVVDFAYYGISTEMKCAPITDNPKVREISYAVRASAYTSVEEFLIQRRRFGGGSACEVSRAAEEKIRELLYDFNNDHSRELATFSNPLRAEQQGKFQDLVFGYLQPFASENGITLKSAHFAL
jgi:hypothetical protein